MMGRRKGEAILLGEVNLPPEEQVAFFGERGGEQLDMLFSFTVNQAMYLALARADARPLAAALAALPPIPADCQWGNFVRNHDELTLDKLSDGEREEVFAAFGPEPELQLYGRGLRRRLPTMLGGDQRRIRLAYSLMFSLPGTPVLFYGEEIGMAENLAIEGRYAVRAPMQWSDEAHAGFTDRRRAGAAGADRRAVRLRGGQRRGAAARPGLAAQLDGAADPPPARVPGAGLGRVGGARAGRSRRVRAPRRLGRLDDRRGPQPRRERHARRRSRSTPTACSSTSSGPPTCRSTGRRGSRSSRTATAGSGCDAPVSASRPDRANPLTREGAVRLGGRTTTPRRSTPGARHPKRGRSTCAIGGSA